MSDPLVSVHMITYNHEPYIAQAIEGVLLQKTSFPLELVIGEDCSTDRTRDIVCQYGRRYPEIINVITSEQNVGAHANSLRVRQACRGRYIAMCDGDDYWTDPHKLQKQVDFLEAHPEYSMCCHDLRVTNDGVPSVKRWIEFSGDTFTFDDAVRGHFIPTSSVVYKRAVVTAVPEWMEECVSQDIPTELLALDQGLGHYLHETMGVKRDHPGGISWDPRRGEVQSESFLKMYKRLDVYTQRRHRRILRWKIAKLSMKIAANSRRAGRRFQFLKYFLDSLLLDRTVFYQAVQECMSSNSNRSKTIDTQKRPA